MRKKGVVFFLFYLLAFGIIVSAAQLGKLKSKIADQVLRSKPVVTTSLKDAKTEVPFLDDYNPPKFYQLRRIPLKSGEVKYYSIPGSWTITLKSYCLNAGKYAPAEGNGYLYAPLKGDWQHLIRLAMMEHLLASRRTERIAEPYFMLLKGGPFLEFGHGTPYLTLVSGQEGGVGGGIDLSGSSAVSGSQGEQPEGMGGSTDDFPVIDLSGEEEVSGEEEDFPVIDLSGGVEDDFNNPEYLNAYFYAYSCALFVGWMAAVEGVEYDDSGYQGDLYESLPDAAKRGFEDGWKAGYNEGYTQGEEFRAKMKKSRGRKPPLSG